MFADGKTYRNKTQNRVAKFNIMLLVSVTDFRANISKYLQLATKERIAIKSKSGIFDLTPSKEIRTNPSPSNDSYWNVPENVASVERGKAEAAQGLGMPFEEFRKMLEL